MWKEVLPMTHGDDKQEAQLSEELEKAAEDHGLAVARRFNSKINEQVPRDLPFMGRSDFNAKSAFISGARWMAERKDNEWKGKLETDRGEWVNLSAELQSKLAEKDAEYEKLRQEIFNFKCPVSAQDVDVAMFRKIIETLRELGADLPPNIGLTPRCTADHLEKLWDKK
jgi:hypothetical protein